MKKNYTIEVFKGKEVSSEREEFANEIMENVAKGNMDLSHMYDQVIANFKKDIKESELEENEI